MGATRGCRCPREPDPQTSVQWKEFLSLAGDISDEKLDRVIDSQKPNQCCTLVYTVGSTSPSRIVMLSHDNVSVPPAGLGPGAGHVAAPGDRD